MSSQLSETLSSNIVTQDPAAAAGKSFIVHRGQYSQIPQVTSALSLHHYREYEMSAALNHALI